MKTAEEIRKEILSSETEEVAKILENLDENSIVLARTYMTALADRSWKKQGWQRQQYEKGKGGGSGGGKRNIQRTTLL